jgi:ribosomal protein L31
MSWIIYTFVCRELSKPSYVVDYRAQKKKNVYIKCSAHNVFQWTTQSCQVQWTTQSCQVQWTTQSCQYNERLSLVSTMNDQSCQYNERLSLVSTMNGSVLSVQCVQWYINNNICFVNRPVYVRTQRLSHNRVVVRFTITYAKLNCACSMSVRDPVYSMQWILQEWQ